MNPSEPPEGQRWTECNHCGHWFDRSLPTCDACGKPNDGSHPAPVDGQPVTVWLAIRIGLALLLTMMILGFIAFERHRVPTGIGILTLIGALFGLVQFEKKEDN